MKPVYIGLLVLSVVFFDSCYDYGKTHEPYTLAPKIYNLPPPPEKIVGRPDTKKEYMQKTYTEIKNTIQEAEVQLIDDRIKVLFPDNIIYKSKDEFPSAEYMEPLKKFVVLLKKYYRTNILVTGHSDNKGDKNKNRELSARRALNIKNTLIDLGVSGGRLSSWGVGAAAPLESNDTKEGRDKNRRVEFIVLYQE